MTEPSSLPRGKGYHATTPSEIPKPGWWSIFSRVYAAAMQKNISVLAAGIAFYGVLSLFPALAVLVAIYGYFASPAIVQHQVAAIHGLMPAEAQALITKYLKSIVHSSSSTLGLSLVIGTLIALWSAMYGTESVMGALNVIYEEQEKRGTVWFYLVALAMTLGAICFAIVALLLIGAIPVVLDFLHSGKDLLITLAGTILPWPILTVLMTVALAVTYRFAPSRSGAKWRWVTWGSFVATLLWIIASILFSVYVTKFNSYNRTFGSLGAIVVLLMWFYISAYVVLLGAAFNAEMERQTARDTTTGPERPMGTRGAKMADTVAHDEGAPRSS